VIRDNVANGGGVRLSAAIVASWARFAEGFDEEGNPIEVVDALAAVLTQRASRYPEDELVFLRDRDLFGALIDDKRFVDAYRTTLRMLHERGSLATLRRVLNES